MAATAFNAQSPAANSPGAAKEMDPRMPPRAGPMVSRARRPPDEAHVPARFSGGLTSAMYASATGIVDPPTPAMTRDTNSRRKDCENAKTT